RVPADAARKGPAAVAEPVTQTGHEEHRVVRRAIAARVPDAIQLADPVRGRPEAERHVETAVDAELVRNGDVADARQDVVVVAIAAGDVRAGEGDDAARPVRAETEVGAAGRDRTVVIAGRQIDERRQRESRRAGVVAEAE